MVSTIRLVLLVCFLLFALIKLNESCVNNCEQSFIEKPKNTSVLNGTEATLRCHVKNQKGEIVWCRDESFCTFSRKRNFADGRMSFAGVEANGEHHLVIASANITDNTQYQCQVTASDYAEAIKSEWAFLTVVVAPSSAKLTSNSKDDSSKIVIVLNQSFSFECIAELSNPAANFSWFLDAQELTVGGDIVEMSKRTISVSNKLHKTAGKLVYKASNTDWNGKMLKCEAFAHSASIKSSSVTDTKRIQVNHSPIIKIIKKTLSDLLDGTFSEFECHGSGRPPITRYRWYIGNKELSAGPNEKFLNLKIELGMKRLNLKCDATNDIGLSTASFFLDITYGPNLVRSLPSHQLVHHNDMLSLHCEVDSNPPASIVWLLNDTVIYTYPNITITAMRAENYGTYTCKASLKDFPVVSSSIKIIPPGPPNIDASPVQSAFYNSMGTIECYISIEPKADRIEWFKNENKINIELDRKYSTSSGDAHEFNKKEMLIINDVSSSDMANYTCKASNSYGSNSRRILFVPKVNSMISFLTISIIIVFMALMSGALFIYIYFKYQTNKNMKKRMVDKMIRDLRRARQQQQSSFNNPYTPWMQQPFYTSQLPVRINNNPRVKKKAQALRKVPFYVSNPPHPEFSTDFFHLPPFFNQQCPAAAASDPIIGYDAFYDADDQFNRSTTSMMLINDSAEPYYDAYQLLDGKTSSEMDTDV